MSAQSHYEVLGVSTDADQLQIRAAYVSLLKRHHPDRAVANESENSAEIQLIVGAYRILKDPATRARYDATLRQLALHNPPFIRRPARARPEQVPVWKFGRMKKHFSLDSETISYGVMFIVAAVGLHLLVSRVIYTGSPHSPRAVASAPQVRELAAHLPLEAAVRNAGMMSGPEASNFSSRCFAAARRSRNPAAADPCVGFDMAYVYWRETMGGPLVTDPYFQPDVIGSRARDAFRNLSPVGATARVQSVRAATLRAIMQSPRATDEFAPPPSRSETASLNETMAEASPKGN